MRRFNSLPAKILGLTKLKALAEGKFYVANMMISAFDRVEIVIGNAAYQHISFSGNVSMIFKRSLFQGCENSELCFKELN